MKHNLLVWALALSLVLGLAAPVWADNYDSADLILEGSAYSAWGSSGKGWTDLAGGATYSPWAGWVEYEVYLTAGEWTYGLEVINRGYLGTNWYSAFHVRDSITGQTMSIPASDDTAYIGQQTAEIFSDGLYTIRFTWLNDAYSKSGGKVRDANLQINTVFFDKAGSSASTPEPATLLLVAGGLAGLWGWRRRRILA
ncbi:MAG: PEP-CTERM sorting domain-containing protein [Desulfarculaceae bacterium]|nr:PEP-CTERM sorting domain-containing protein [Desulfarculaceae bacterium]MCF8073932.1 PEP-CTERM sorting domain-containing protein [Desulfarculaceae bacterium]MCF8102618.1 PEP-CTERM sorting domain-containing protein [Desulfarculaceae bacterium]MCF8117613.1 PEP-CTERM sorting domain-containing protein [Desulfarculaceae bacterium]